MSERHHFATLDGLRGVAAIVVLALHAVSPFPDFDWLISHGGLAVDFFFCLSGFVIGYAYEDRLLGTMSFFRFAIARVIRLYPLIIVGLLLGATTFIVKAVISHQPPISPSFLVAFLLEAFLIPVPPILGDGWSESTPFDVSAWSLLFEFLANFVYAALVRRLTTRVLIFLLGFGALSVFVQAHFMGGVSGGGNWSDVGCGVARVFFPFLCGIFLFRRWKSRVLRDSCRFAALTPVALLVVLCCPVPSSVKWLYESAAVVILFPMIINIGALDMPGPLVKSIYLFLGRLSYPLYILHYPLVIRPFSHTARALNLRGIEFWLLIAAEMSTAIGVSILAMKFFDEPVRAWLTRKFNKSVRTPLLAPSSACRD